MSYHPHEMCSPTVPRASMACISLVFEGVLPQEDRVRYHRLYGHDMSTAGGPHGQTAACSTWLR
jgi:hypothetical protein